MPRLASDLDPPSTNMADAGPTTGGQTGAAFPLGRVINHRTLVASKFPRQVSEEMRDAPAAAVEEQVEIYHGAASQGMLSSVLALLADKSFPCDLPDHFGRTALHWATEQGRRNVVLALLRAGACVDPRSQRGITPITLAASGGHVKVVRVLLHYRASNSDCWPSNRDRRSSDSWRSTALHCAAAGGHVRTVAVLLGAGFDRQQKDGAGVTPAELSARTSHSTSAVVTRLLLPKGDRGGELLYDHVHALMEDVAIVSGLVKGGAFLDWQDYIGETPLHRAVRFRHAAITKILLRAGANPNLRDSHGACPLHVAACTEGGEIVADLLEAGADTEILVEYSQSPLLRAVWNNRVNVVRLLLDAGASMDREEDRRRQSPLSWACRGRLAPIVRVLVEAGADVESKDWAELTPLHWACRLIDVESVELLLNAGANPGAVDQAAADAVVVSSSTSGTSVSKPVAIDVIGLGFPLHHAYAPMGSFNGGTRALAARWLDVASVTRIESALQVATQKYCWRHRGWLVMLNNRCVVIKLSGVRDRWWADCRGGNSTLTPVAVQSRCVYTDVKHLLYTQQTRAATGGHVGASTKEYCSDGSDSRHPQAYLSNGQNNVGKRLRVADSMMMIASALCRQNYQTCCGIGTGEEVGEVLFSDVVGALLELATVEVGVFRRVVMFI